MNQVTLIGRLARTPNYYDGENPRVLFTLAVDRRSGDTPDYIGMVAFGPQATAVARYTDHGHLVAVEGRIQSRSYEKDGATVYVTEVVANRVDFLARPKGASDQVVAA